MSGRNRSIMDHGNYYFIHALNRSDADFSEYHIPSIVSYQACCQIFDVAYVVCFVTQGFQCLFNCLDCVKAIKLGSFLLAKAFCEIIFSKIISDPYLHGVFLFGIISDSNLLTARVRVTINKSFMVSQQQISNSRR